MEMILLYIGRIMFGYAKSKGIPYPKLSVAFSGLLLLIGGISVLFNIFPVIGFVSLAMFFIPVALIIYAPWKVKDPQAKMIETVNFTKNFVLTGAVLILLAYTIV